MVHPSSLFFSTLLLSTLLLTTIAEAVPTPHSMKQGAPKQGGSVSRNLAIIELQSTLYERQFLESATVENRAIYVATLERLVPPYCTPNVRRDFVIRGQPSDPRCIELLERILELDGNNPLALCARYGLNESSCINAYEQQGNGIFDPDSQSWRDDKGNSGKIARLDLDSVVQMKANLGKLPPLMERLLAIIEGLKVQRSEEKVAEAKTVAQELLHRSCNPMTIALIPHEQPTPTPAPAARTVAPAPGTSIFDAPEAQSGAPSGRPTQPGSDDEFGNLLRQLDSAGQPGSALQPGSGTAPTAAPVVPAQGVANGSHGPLFHRIRLLPQRCMENIEQILVLDNLNPTALCYKFGFFSPACLQLEEQQVMSSTTLPAQDGFDQF